MEEKITNLIEGCLLYFRKNSYSSCRIKVYESLWHNGIVPYMAQNNLTIYNPDVGQRFMSSVTHNGVVTTQVREKIRSVQVLDDYLKLGYVRTRRTIPVEHPLLGEVGEQMQKHIKHLHDLRRSKITIRRNRVYMYRFLLHLNKNQVCCVKDIQDQHIASFLSSPETNNHHVISTLRVLFNFWYDENVTAENLAYSLEYFKPRRKEKIPSYYAKDEILEFEKSVSRASGLGKRNYAALLIASRLGLRASDIVSLKFSSIDWESNEIRVQQYKTGNPITLPLLTEVGNAIIDYLKYGRPQSEHQHIFLSHRPPYGIAEAKTISAAIGRILVSSGVLLDGRRHGSHSLRHSLASRLLEQETTMPIISDTLGHSSSQTTMRYLRIDITSLKKCALHVPRVPDSFYTQKGGVFYE